MKTTRTATSRLLAAAVTAICSDHSSSARHWTEVLESARVGLAGVTPASGKYAGPRYEREIRIASAVLDRMSAGGTPVRALSIAEAAAELGIAI